MDDNYLAGLPLELPAAHCLVNPYATETRLSRVRTRISRMAKNSNN